MTTEDKARELIVKERLANEERHEKMVNRAVETEEAYHEDLEETARELLTQDRQHEAQREENMLQRAVEEIQEQ